MKIVCDACQAKYSISDDKVQGKVFKIRCKKCSNIIVVRGGAGAAEPAAAPAPEKDTRVYDYGHEGGDQAPSDDESVWHVVINQDQVGPMTAAEVQQRFAAGEIDAETYAWREGFADWLPLAQVDAFAAYVASGSTTAAVSSGAGAAAVSAMFGGGDEAGTVRSDPGDLFATASASASAAGSDDDNDLFGSKPASSSSSSASAQAAANAKLRGERNENSVLFSLNNLAQLASDKPAPSAGSVSSMPSGQATGAAGGEGSGLIDIRSMANAYLGGSSGGAAKAASASSIGSIDDLPVFGGGGFSEPAVIVPVSQRGGNNKMMYALIGSVGFLALAAVILVIVLVTGGDKDDKSKVAANDKDDVSDKVDDKATGDDNKEPDDPAKAAGSGDSTDTAKAPDTTDTAKPPEKDPDTTTTAKPEVKRDPKPSTGRSDPKPTTSRTDPKPKTTTTAPAPKDTGGGGCDEVSCVLNNYEGACCAKFKKGGGTKASGGTTAAKSSDVPDGLTRDMIQAGVNKVKARVMQCGDKSSAKGQVKVSVKVSGGGSVENVSVKASPDAALGSCVASAMQRASFGKTQNGGSFAYPFNF